MTQDELQIELIAPPSEWNFSHVLFDFDGTLSLIRKGWPEIMLPVFLESLRDLDHGLSEDDLATLAREDIDELTGKETIFQMIRLAERITQFGGTPAEPLEYKQEYLRRLMDHIQHRREALASGAAQPVEYLLPGSRELLAGLVERGCTVYLASGTDEPFVKEEARLLGVAEYFGPHIYGAGDDVKTIGNVKRNVIEKILRTHDVPGNALLGFGDGFVEIEDVTAVGGYAVGVASDEEAGGGKIDTWKRERLLRAGAKAIVADFAQADALLKLLFEEGE